MKDYKNKIVGEFCKGNPGPQFEAAWADLAEAEAPLWELKPTPDPSVVMKTWRSPGLRPWSYTILSEEAYRQIIEARWHVLASLAADVSAYDAVLRGMGLNDEPRKEQATSSPQGAYEAYVAARGGLDHQGKPMFSWDALDDERAWWEAVHAYYVVG